MIDSNGSRAHPNHTYAPLLLNISHRGFTRTTLKQCRSSKCYLRFAGAFFAGDDDEDDDVEVLARLVPLVSDFVSVSSRCSRGRNTHAVG